MTYEEILDRLKPHVGKLLEECRDDYERQMVGNMLFEMAEQVRKMDVPMEQAIRFVGGLATRQRLGG